MEENIVEMHEMPDMTGESASEETVGITEFLTPELPGFVGILKHRYSDFNVYEIDTAGRIVHLTDLNLPVEKEKPGKPETFLKYNELSEDDKELLSALTWSRLTQLSKKYYDNEFKASENETVTIDVTSKEKDQRKKIHQLIKTHFPNLNSDTSDPSPSKKIISVNYTKKAGGANNREWPRDRPKYLHFTLYKENLDTFSALSQLKKHMGLKRNRFQSAGTKDKRARTTQRVSIAWTSADKIRRAAKNIRFASKVVVGNFSFEKDGLRLGDLQGNRFCIVLRNTSEPLEKFEPALLALRQEGFINYFGLQRFGTMSVKTSDVGLALIKGDWMKAIELILQPRPNEKPPLSEVRSVWWKTRDAKAALELLSGPSRYSIESTLLRGLAKNDKDLVGALGFIGRSQKSMYTHAYQSLIWNVMVSKRIKKYGKRVLLGDLVQDGKLPPRNLPKEEPDSEENYDFSANITIITEDNMKDFTIYDVVMPQPGYDIKMPENEIKEWYDSYLEKDGLSLEKLRNKVSDFSLPGSYRKIIVQPKDVEWRIISYSDPNKNLTLSDYDKIQGHKPIEDEVGGKYRALILELSLPICSYATMALREVTKEQTSKVIQTQLTENYNKANDESQQQLKKRKLEEE